MKPCTALAFAALILGAFGPAHAVMAWDEDTQGDLSDNGLMPTTLTFGLGPNTVLGNAGSGDRDYFNFSVSAGWRLSAITLRPETVVSGSVGFMAIQAGPQLTVAPNGAGAAALLAYGHYGEVQIGNNLLLDLGVPGGLLPSGTYSLWVQETGGPATYGFDFVISEVPEPGSAALLLAGLLGTAALRRRALR